ncbi:hypothetical protein ALQ04_00334 [Pseudomonas cichorii]|uniref:Transmembrane protein n=1 Tax=Pseudomonas cichorii TaxID=36746 RepID=A0A3M4M6E2_PSECI|nr:hypothetical protein [Pseudomonas cichorii]RMQ49153.1 hypothetical protein ALQ04_00334 [Pseudomonas cichorii]
MGTAMNPVGVSELRRRRRGRLQLLVLLLLAIGPMILATCMYRLNFWIPDGRSYHGQLIGNGQSRTDLGVQADEQRWQLLVSAPRQCTADCQHLVYLARQIHTGLGRDAHRASHALATALTLDGEYVGKLQQEYPQLQRYALDVGRYRKLAPELDAPMLWIVDPHGNLVLRYDAGVKGKELLNDLRQLLKLSNIG